MCGHTFDRSPSLTLELNEVPEKNRQVGKVGYLWRGSESLGGNKKEVPKQDMLVREMQREKKRGKFRWCRSKPASFNTDGKRKEKERDKHWQKNESFNKPTSCRDISLLRVRESTHRLVWSAFST